MLIFQKIKDTLFILSNLQIYEYFFNTSKKGNKKSAWLRSTVIPTIYTAQGNKVKKLALR